MALRTTDTSVPPPKAVTSHRTPWRVVTNAPEEPVLSLLTHHLIIQNSKFKIQNSKFHKSGEP
jgi:hypothetical protein